MKISTIALATALALSSTFALAQSSGGSSGAGSAAGGAAASGSTTGSSMSGTHGKHGWYGKRGSLDGHGPDYHQEPVRKHRRCGHFAQRVNARADRSGLRPQQVANISSM